jgi:hypothetical protein
MKRLHHLALFAAALSTAATSQAWESSLYRESFNTSRVGRFASDKLLQDFSYAGYHRSEKDLPHPTGKIFDPLTNGADPTGQKDSTAAIQKAIDDAANAGGGVVPLPAGTFLISVPSGKSAALEIKHSAVVLRGAGREKTFLLNTTVEMKKKAVISVRPSKTVSIFRKAAERIPLREDITTPTRRLSLASVEGLKVGMQINLRAELTDEWLQEHREPGWQGEKKPMSGFAYLRDVVQIDSRESVIEVDIPIRYSVLRRDNAGVEIAPPLLTEVGIEHFSVGNLEHQGDGWDESDFDKPDRAAWHADSSDVIHFQAVRDSWIREVGSFRAPQNRTATEILSNGIRLDHCRNVTIASCDFSHPQFGGANGNGYMFRIQESQEILVRDCVAEYSRHGFVFGGFASSGNVILQCVDRISGAAVGDGQKKPLVLGYGSDHHMWFSHSNLIDSCTAEQSAFAAFYRPWSNHFVTAAHTVFWNITSDGARDGYGIICQQARYGYVVGTRGSSAKVQLQSPTGKGTDATEPSDHVEGIGEGATLEPQSLYLEQLRRRMSQRSR